MKPPKYENRHRPGLSRKSKIAQYRIVREEFPVKYLKFLYRILDGNKFIFSNVAI